MADNLKFEMPSTSFDYTQARFAWLKFNKLFIIFIICMALLFIGSWFYYPFVQKEHKRFVSFLIFVGSMGTICPFVSVLGRAQAEYKLSRKYVEGLTTYEMNQQNFMVHSKGLNLSWAWERIIAIRETKNFIFISPWWMTFTIYKSNLDIHVLKSLKRLLEEIPVKNKYLLKEKCKGD